MRVTFDEDLSLEIPNLIKSDEKLSAETPIANLLNKKFYRTEVGLHTGALKSILIKIYPEERIRTALDAMCGCGFGTSVIHKYLPNTIIDANDYDKDLAFKINELSFISTAYCTDVEILFSSSELNWDLVFIDFNTFSIKNEKWLNLLKKIWEKTNKWLLFTDTACFGFKFTKNLASYEVESSREYYIKLANKIISNGGYLRYVSSHRNAAIVALSKRKGPFEELHGDVISIDIPIGLFS